MRRTGALALLCALWAAQPAPAEIRSISYSLWDVAGESVMLRYILPREELKQMVPSGWPAPDLARVSRYLLGHTEVRSAQGICPPIDQGYDIGLVDPLAVGPDLYGYEIMFRCRTARGILLRNGALFDEVPRHLDFVRVRVGGGDFIPQLFSAPRHELHLPDSGAPRAAAFTDYLGVGFLHIWHNLDRLVFLLALALLAPRRRDLALVLAGLLLGYLAAVAVAVTSPLVLSLKAAEAWIGFLVALAAAQSALSLHRSLPAAIGIALALLLFAAIAAASDRTDAAILLLGAAILASSVLRVRLERPARMALWMGLAAVFALLDGLALPTDWARLHLSTVMPHTSLCAYGAGAWLADAVALGMIAGMQLLVPRIALRAPRALLHDAITAALAGLGVFWLVSRLSGW
jgi:hypothetical protein